jgi:hypothetical protein
MGKKKIITIASIWLLTVLLSIWGGWTIGNPDRAGYELQISALQYELSHIPQLSMDDVSFEINGSNWTMGNLTLSGDENIRNFVLGKLKPVYNASH